MRRQDNDTGKTMKILELWGFAGIAGRLQTPRMAPGLSHVVNTKIPVVSTKAPLDFARGKLRAARRDLLSPISCLSGREGLSAPRFALRSRRRKSPHAIALRMARVATLATALLAPLPAIAADPVAPRSGFYVGGHIGYMFGNANATLGDPTGIASAGGITGYGAFFGGAAMP